MEQFTDLLQLSYFGNTLHSYLVAFAVFLLTLIFFQVLKGRIFVKLAQWAKRTKTDLDDELIRLVETIPGMLNGGMGKPPIPSSPPVIPLNFMARTHISWPKARCNMAKAVTLTLTTMGHTTMAKRIAEKENKNLILIDGSPGIGCPVIASLSGVDLALIVTEPTMSGIHDLKRILSVAKHFNIKTVVCVNKYDINLENTNKISSFCENKEIKIIGKIPFNPQVTKAMVD